MDDTRLGIIDKLNDESRLSENGLGPATVRVRYGVMCVNVSLHGITWKCMCVHRLALMKDPTNLGLQEILHL